jgi:hypothetical protein
MDGTLLVAACVDVPTNREGRRRLRRVVLEVIARAWAR